MYGFRVYSLQVGRGTTHGRFDLANPMGDGRRLDERIEDAAQDLVARGLLTGVPNHSKPVLWAPVPAMVGDVQTQFEGARRLGPTSVLLMLRYGHYGEFDVAMSASGDVDLRNKAAATTFRALFLMPMQGTEGRLIVEAHDRKCPVSSLVGWYGRAEFDLTGAPWCRLWAEQLRDPARLRALVRDAETITATLKQVFPGHPGAADGERVTLTHKTKDHYKRESFVAGLLSALDAGQSDEGMIERIEEIAGYDPQLLDEAGLRFNKATVTVEDSDGQTKTINMDALQAKFTYPVSEDLRPSDDMWLDRVRQELVGPLSAGTDIQF